MRIFLILPGKNPEFFQDTRDGPAHPACLDQLPGIRSAEIHLFHGLQLRQGL